MLVKRFEEQVSKFPDKIAVKTRNNHITYANLNHSANQVARTILEQVNSINKEVTVGLLFNHGTDMIVGMIGALKTGMIYVPLDPSYPEERLTYMLHHSEATFLITNNSNLGKAQRIAAQEKEIAIINIDLISKTVSDENLHTEFSDGQKAYILYTSGSTGNPKGVIQNHENIWHFIRNYTHQMAITSDDRLTLFSAFSHDAAVMDIYCGLLNGATLYPLNIKTQENMQGIANWLKTEQITVWHSVPTLYRYFIRTLQSEISLPDLKLIVLGGGECTG